MTLVSKQPYMYYLVHTIHLPAGANKRRLNRGLVVLTVVVTVVDVVVAASATACAAFAAACAASAAACSTTGDDDVVVVVVVVATVVRSDCRRRRLWGVARDVPVRCRVLRVGRVVGEVRARRGRSLASEVDCVALRRLQNGLEPLQDQQRRKPPQWVHMQEQGRGLCWYLQQNLPVSTSHTRRRR
jgi:hypothetical protein